MTRVLRNKLFQEAAEAPDEGTPLPSPEAAAASTTPAAEAAPAAEAVEPEETQEDMWGSLLDDDEPPEEVPPETPEPSPEPEAQVGDEPEPEPQPEPEEATPEPTPEAVAPETPPEPEPQEAPPQPEQPQEPTPEERQALMQQRFSTLYNSYQLSQEDADAMAVNPEKVMPRLLAGVHMSIENQVMQQVQQILPNFVSGILKQERSQQEVVEKFYSRWPQLRQHESEVNKFAGVWRQMNPGASVTEAQENIGKHVMIALGYPVDGRSVDESRPSAPPAPAAPSAVVPPAPAPSGPRNQYEQLAEEFLEEDY